MAGDAEYSALRSEYYYIERQMEGLQDTLDALSDQMCDRGTDLVCATLGVDKVNVSFGRHHCPKSPIEECCYDMDQDPCEDNCLFCGAPNERK